jgi:hypothetical protein
MPQWLQDLTAGWPMIRANLPTFAVILLLMFAAVWWFVNYVHGGSISNRDGIISNKDSEIALLRSQRDEYKNKLSGATPDEAKAKIEALEARLSAIEPRRLGQSIRAALVASLKPPSDSQYSVSISVDMTGDGRQYGSDFKEVFRDAKWAVSDYSVLTGVRPPSGIAISFADKNNPSPEAKLVLSALRDQPISPSIFYKTAFNQTRLQTLIC